MTNVCCCKQRYGSALILTIIDANANANANDNVLSTLEAIYTKDILIVLNVYTLKDHRRKGYGTMLLKRVIWEAQRNKNHLYRIELDNLTDGTNDFYEKNGFAYVSAGFPEMYWEPTGLPLVV